jgi:hypothetical protein
MCAICRETLLSVMTQSWAVLPQPHQQRVVSKILCCVASDPSHACRIAAHTTLEQLPMSAAHLQSALQRLQHFDADAALHTLQHVSVAKRRKSAGGMSSAAAGSLDKVGDATMPHLSAALDAAIPVLEVLQWKRGIKNVHELLEPLQGCLRSCTALLEACGPAVVLAAAAAPGPALGSSTLTPLMYASQLILSALKQIVVTLDPGVAVKAKL